MKAIKARFSGKCGFCGGPFAAGDPILNKGGKWGHENCNGKAEAAPAKPKKVFVPSVYQAAMFAWMKDGRGNALIEAVAGSGKTTTILQALEFTRPDQAVVFLAFNKHIANELQERAPSHVTVKTLHSLGLANLTRKLGKLVLDEQKVDGILDDLKVPSPRDFEETKEKEAARTLRQGFRRVVSLVKATLTDYRERSGVEALLDNYNIDLDEDREYILDKLPWVLDACRSTEHGVIDFDDMLWLPIVLNITLEKFDWVFVDECQDLNANQIEFVLRLRREGTRIVAVGDRRQSLYAFRGADTEAVDRIVAALEATTLPLSITYRCPTSHVALAKQIVPQIEAREGAPEGSIFTIKQAEFPNFVKPGDMVVCRTNAPLVGPAFALLRRDIKAVIRGRDIGQGLIALAKKITAGTIDETLVKLTNYNNRERSRLEARNAPDSAFQALEDKVETLSFIIAECETPDAIEAKIANLFSDDQIGVVFSSVHRAKGLEAERVFILRPDQLPLTRKGQSEKEIEQEWNCAYVAYTRSKNELWFVEQK